MSQLTLRSYQAAAADKLEAILREKRVAYLRGAVRTGKTLTALSLLLRFKKGGQVLIVTKLKAMASIEKDARDLLGENAQYVEVINFEQLHKYAGRSYMMVIVDESHNLASFPKPNLRVKALLNIRAALWLLMTGTPSPESFSQMFHQFHVAGKPWPHKNFYAWAKDYVRIKQKRVSGGALVNDYKDADRERILREIEPYTVTMTQQDAGFETQITERVHYVRMKPRTMRIYRRILKDGVVGGLKGRCVLADTEVKVMSKCLQLSGGTVITERHGAMIIDRSKVEYIQRTFRDSKLAVLYVYDAEGKMLREAFGDRAVSTPEAFNDRPDAVFIGQVRSSREGVNLSSATDVAFYGVEHSALSRLQGMDRASYLGRTQENRVHYILAEGTVEKEVYEVVRGKETFTTQHYARYRKNTLQPKLELA